MVKQATALVLLLFAVATAAEEGKIEYQAPVVEKVLFDDSLSMFEAERAEYATNLAAFAANQVVSMKASRDSLESARRILALALHLDRRNRMAMVVNGQLKRGVLPEVKVPDYNPRSFSRLLLSRAKLLKRNESERERFLSLCFVELAALVDPRNEDAVFDYENQLLDHGEIDWRLVTDAVKDEPSQAPAQE